MRIFRTLGGSMIIGRRKFFSFFGTGVAMVAAPGLFIPDTSIRAAKAEELEAMARKWEQDFMAAVTGGTWKQPPPIFMLAG
jgi:hypothetical protein